MKPKSQLRKPHWLWILPIMLLFTLVVGSRLDMDGLWYDEVFTVRNAGGANFGPLSPLGIYETIQTNDPYQAIGYPLTVAAWGAFVGWSEFALRVSSLLFALIGVALTYRLGRDVSKSDWVGLLAALIFAFSTFTVHYAHELRAFTFVTIFAVMTIWSYWRILERPSTAAFVLFTLGGIGVLYAHYYAAMLLIAIGLFHLLFAPKNRHWIFVPICALLMGLAFIPQTPAFLEGFTRFDPANVEKSPMGVLDVVNSLLYYIGNGRNVITLAVMLVGVIAVVVQKARLGIVVGIAILGTAVLIISNEWLNILEPTRLRYAIFLWSLYAVWIAAGMEFSAGYLASRFKKTQWFTAMLTALTVLWLANALVANNTSGFNASIEGTETPRMRTLVNELREHGARGDLFAFYNGTSQQAWYIQDTLAYSLSFIPMPGLTTASLYDLNESTRQWASEQVANTQRVWYGANLTFGLNQVHDDFLALMNTEFVLCDTLIRTDDLSLQLYARSQAFCMTDTPVMRFDGFTLTGYEINQTEDTLLLDLGWQLAPDVTPDTYSLAVHILSADNPEPIAQFDVGFGFDSVIPMSLELDLSDVPAGEYEIALIVYAWQTGERLAGQHLVTKASGERLILSTFTR